VDKSNPQYKEIVRELGEKKEAARDIQSRIEAGTATAEHKTSFRQLVKDIRDLSEKRSNFLTAESLEEFKKLEAGAKKSKGFNPANAGSRAKFTNLGSTITETETLDEKTLSQYASLKRELGGDKFDAVIDPDYAQAFCDALRYGKSGMDRGLRKALDPGDDGRGYVTAPAEVLSFIVGRLNAPTRITSLVREVNTIRDSVSFLRNPYDDDNEYTNTFRRKKTGSKPRSSTEGNVMASTDEYFAPVKIDVHTFLFIAQINNDLLEDSTFDLAGWLKRELSASVLQDQENDIINGDGVAAPMGVSQYFEIAGDFTISAVNSGSTTTFTYDGLQNLLWDMPEQYIENAVLIGRRTSAGKEIAKLRNAGGDRVFGDPGANNGGSLVGPSGQRLEGYPVIWSSKMPAIAENAYPLLFWDPTSYMKLTRSNISFMLLDQTKAKENQTEIIGKVRYGGDLLEPYKCRVQKMAV
jgi:HK97 family phage major capsid protein